MKGISVSQLVEEGPPELDLEVIVPGKGAKLPITVSEVNRPGLALAGFTQNFLYERIQVLGETETLYLDTLSAEERHASIDRLFGEKSVPLLRTRMSTTPFIRRLGAHLTDVFAPRTTLHGSLVDVYGVGLLFTGESGIGKSETALDLVERGHRLVADDIVIVSRRGPSILVGSSNELLGHRMEIRGVGIVDVREMFGVRATRLRKRIEVEVRLEPWDPDAPYERLGLDDRTTSVLGVRIPYVTIPLVPGKNVTVLAEVVAMNHLIKTSGRSPAADLDERLRTLIEQDRAASPIGDVGDTE
jgi:HPr kinase/phosphorylase